MRMEFDRDARRPLQPEMPAAAETAAAVKALRSEACACGAAKERGRAFCYECYTSLPGEMQRALWSRMFRGFEGAYREAAEWLEARRKLG